MPPNRDKLDSLLPVLLFAGIALAGVLAITGAYWCLGLDLTAQLP